jgi:hypothetical protein
MPLDNLGCLTYKKYYYLNETSTGLSNMDASKRRCHWETFISVEPK